MDEYFTCGCLLRMFECEWYVWVYDMTTFSLAYPFACLCVMCGLYLCDDHQPCWCEQMWELLAVVMVMEMLWLDALDRCWAHCGAHYRRIFIIYVFLDEQDPVFLNYVVQYISGWAMWGPFLVIRVFWTYCIHSYPKSRTLWLFMYVMFYLLRLLNFGTLQLFWF